LGVVASLLVLAGAVVALPASASVTSASVSSGAEARAQWLDTGTVAVPADWGLGPSLPAGDSAELVYSSTGAISIQNGEITGGGSSLRLLPVSGGLTAAQRATYPNLKNYAAFTIDPADRSRITTALRSQLVMTERTPGGGVVAATGVQIPGALDAIYASSAAHARLGPVIGADGRPTLSVWAPTAQSVSLELYDTADATSAQLISLHRDDTSGVWSVTGDASWKGKYYLYRVSVWAPSVQKFVTNHVTDPYSLALSTDAERSEIVSLDDPALAPPGWSDERSPTAVPAQKQEIQELHVRDFSIADTTVPAQDRGTYLAFTHRDSAGMRHMQDLVKAGVTAVHIMPAFDFAGVPDAANEQATPPCDPASYAPDSDQQQACIAKTAATDGYDWGYNPRHFTVPEGSYSANPVGTARTVQFRRMVESLHRAGLRVVMDVVYNHTAAAGEAPNSVLDQIVPGYYQRLSDTGAVTTDSCCADTAPEHAMMNKLVVDSTRTWATGYHVDGFRFDLMGIDPKQTFLDVQAALDTTGRSEFLYGEGWNYGVAGNDARFVNADQANMAGTGIATFNDRLRDAARGGGPFDSDPRIQGFASGLYTDPNGDGINGATAQQKATLLHDMDLIEVGLTGDLARYSFTGTAGQTVTGSQIDYNGSPAGYTAAPGEAITYVDAHDNLDLFDALTYKLPAATTMADRVRMQSLALALPTLSQAPGFMVAGSDLMRSKSLDGNSYNSGDWFNEIQWQCAGGNGFGRGLPMAADNHGFWPYAKPLLGDPALVPDCRAADSASRQYQQFLTIKRSSPLFSLGTLPAVQQRLSFPLSGTAAQRPGVITMHLDGTGLPTYRSITVVFNATPDPQRQTVATLAGTRQSLHPVQLDGTDPVVKQSVFDPATGTFTVPGRTVAVFVQR
jgi:pullulanase-type alpha-1,6-glucosidase